MPTYAHAVAEVIYAALTVLTITASVPALLNAFAVYSALLRSGRNGLLHIIARRGIRESMVFFVLQAINGWFFGHGVYYREWQWYPSPGTYALLVARRVAWPLAIAYLCLAEWSDRRRSAGLLPAK